MLQLPSVLDSLTEQTRIVSDPIAAGRERQGGHALHETGRQPAKTAVAQRGIRLDLQHLAEVYPEAAESRLHLVEQTEVAERVAQETADQEFERQIIDPLLHDLMPRAGGCEPGIDNPITHRETGRHIPVVIRRDGRV